MSEHKHTPGPWSIGAIEKVKPSGFEAWIDGQNHGCIAQVVVAMEGEGENENPTLMGNARLIAAAPDLLEALKGLDEAYCRAGAELTKEERHEDRLRLIAARAAITKATGAKQ